MKPERWEHIEHIYKAALERDADERSSYLAEACADDTNLRNEVEALLAASEQSSRFLTTPALEHLAKNLVAESPDDRPSLEIGQELSHYKILSRIGAGGMGEVYRAQDTRLDRIVAIKVLPRHLSSESELRQRFEREARAISSLNHPNICTLYDIGHQDGTDFLVMEYIEGKTLADRLAKGPLPIGESLRCAIQIADALAKAHLAGIVHRDLKPTNIMLTKSGAKLLDFGLAKLQEKSSGRVFQGLSGLPTERHSITAEGAILGTFPYMAPEQLEGRATDARTDIFTFGAVVYEMVTGKRAFAGNNQASLIGTILRDEPPPLSTLQPVAEPALDRVVKLCLAKEPDERWQSAHDVMLELKWIEESGQQAGAQTVKARLEGRDRIPWLFAALFFIIAAIFVTAFLFGRATTEPRTIHLSILPPDGTSFIESLALSPDGQRMAFTATDAAGRTLLWVRPLDSTTPQAINGTEGARFPFWSPDSRFIAFFSSGKLRKVDSAGGSAQTLADVAAEPRGGSWGRDGVILFAPDTLAPLYKVSSTGGLATQVTEFDQSRNEGSHRWPYFLPDGRRFIYFVRGVKGSQGLFVGSLESKDRKFLLDAESSVAYVPNDASDGSGPGLLLFVRERVLMAQPFDAEGLQLSSEPQAVAQNVVHYGESDPTGYGVFSVSTDGILTYRTGSNNVTNQLVWVDRSGKQLASVSASGLYAQPWLSPDEKRIAVDRTDTQGSQVDVWLLELSRGVWTRLTYDPRSDNAPLWSPDGSRIVFRSNRNGNYDLYQRSLGGVGNDELFLRTGSSLFPDDWSSDGRFILYNEDDPNTKKDLWVLPLFANQKPYPFLKTEFNEMRAQLSPDGRWMAYVSDESGRPEVYVRSFPASGGKWQISTNGGNEPRWHRNGKELFYINEDNKLMAAKVRPGATFSLDATTPLFDMRIRPIALSDNRNDYVVAADGQRFLVCQLSDDDIVRPIIVMLNWMADMKKDQIGR